MYVEIDEGSGFCFGVVNAIDKAEKSLDAVHRVSSLGDIVHNRVEVQRLEALGLGIMSHKDIGSFDGAMLIRAHGEPPATYALARKAGVEIIDATCPVVARLQRVVAQAHAEMKEIGGQVVILGKRGHAEVTGLSGQVDGDVVVIEGIDDLSMVDFDKPIYLLSQTTQSLSLFGAVGEEIMSRAKDKSKVKLHDTICRSVANREPHLREFAKRFDVVIFVSGAKSSNGKVLFDVCRGANARSYNIEEASELRSEWFDGAESVGICGATSTPKWLMQDVAQKVIKI